MSAIIPNSLTARLRNRFGWTRHSYFLFSALVITCGLIGIIWWPLAEAELRALDPTIPWWLQADWLLFGNFLVMSLLIMAGADLKSDIWMVGVGLAGGLVIESWGTQTELWFYYTNERPPLWIIPAWPVAALSIDRLVRLLDTLIPENQQTLFKWIYWPVFIGFMALMLHFVRFTFDKSFTLVAILLCVLLIITPTNYRTTMLTFAAGAGLGYFLELWGTTRYCWIYYTYEQPPLFAVLAHGMAAVAFWRTALYVRTFAGKLAARRNPTPQPDPTGD